MGDEIMKQRTKILIPVAVLLVTGLTLLFSSCYPGDPLSTSETDIVATFYNQNADFSTKQTYIRPDRVIDVNDTTLGTDYDALIIGQVDENMQALGFTRVTDPMTADVVVSALVSQTTWVGGACYPPYWGWYYPYYGYGYGWCYPVTYSFQTGTVLLVMVDAADTTSGATNPALWVAGINGLVDGVEAAVTDRISRSIDQAFRQSPYLGEGK
jgi:hypothetical protein